MTMVARNTEALPGRAPRRLASYAGIAFFMPIAAFCVGFIAFAEAVTRYDQPSDIAPADGIIVLTGGEARLGPSIALLSGERGQKLLITGVHPDTTKDAIRAATGGSESLFACCVDLDHDALDTIGNADQSAAWLRQNGYQSAIIVTSNYHMPRAMLEIRRHAGDVRLSAFPIVTTKRSIFSLGTNPGALRVILYEYVKYLAALIRP